MLRRFDRVILRTLRLQRPDPPSKVTGRSQVAAWIAVLALGGILLHGRFDWAAPFTDAAGVAYVLSFFFFVLVLPLTFYGCRLLTRSGSVPFVLCGIEFVLYALPYHAIGLGAFRYDEIVVPWTSLPVPADIVWFPQAFGSPSFLHDLLVVAGTAIVPAALLVACYRRWRSRFDWSFIGIIVATLAVLFLQTLMHSGLRSPYSYTGHFEPNHEPVYWYHDYMLADAKGAVNRDEPAFAELDQTFKGTKDPSNPTFLYRRGFVHYLVSPFSYFFSAYDVFLIVNPLLWLAAVVCTYDVVRRVFDSRQIAGYTAALVACGNGFSYFIAQPMSYHANFVSAIVAVFVLERFSTIDSRPWQFHWRPATLIGVALGLLSLTYDFFIVYPMLLLYCVYRRRSIVDCAMSCAIGGAIFAAYFLVYLKVLNLPDSARNSSLATGAFAGILDLFTQSSLGNVLIKTVGLLSSYVANLGFAFLILVTLLAFGAVVFSRNNHRKAFVGLMLLPSFLENAYLYYGGTMWGGVPLSTLPRLTYIAYPGMYAAAAMSVAGIARLGRLARLGPVLPWSIIAVIAIWQNLDAFGIPALQYHFYWPSPSPVVDEYHR